MKQVTFDEYVKIKGRKPVIAHYQPETFVIFESDDEKKKWVKTLAEELKVDITAKGFTWGDPTFSGEHNYPSDRQGDDCVDD